MPPPSAVDPWLASRRFGIVIDAGSSGSRLQIYSWKDARTIREKEGQKIFNSLPTVEKGTKEGEDWVIKAEPGLSSFAGDPEGVASYLAPLLEHARTQVPPSLQPETPLFLLATAGMRLLSPTQQAEVLQATCQFLKFHSYFRIDDPSEAGPCGSSVRIITGEEEGLFGWIAVNYLMDGFNGAENERTTYGFLDMGGASTQIAFEPSEEERKKTKDLIDVRLRLLGGQEIHHQVFVTTWLGYGTNQARERYVNKTINEYEANRAMSHPAIPSDDTVPDPCLPKDLRLTEPFVQLTSASAHSRQPHMLLGTGSFEQCLQQTAPLLNKDAPCPDTPCLFNGVRVPPIDFSVSHFIGVSEYWYSSEHVFGLGGPYDVVQYERAASDFCSRDWTHIMREHEESRQNGTLGGDGEVFKNGEVVSTGRWGDKVEVSRLQMQCFKAAWLVNVLHEGIGMPRIVDPGGNSTTDGHRVAQQAEDKGLGKSKPQFQSMDSVGDIAISWTLGKMVLEASKEVPPASASTRPLVDPIDDMPNVDNSQVKPIRPPFLDFDAIEDHLSSHLPPSLTRHALGFSLVGLLFYIVVMSFIIVTFWRLRHRIRSTARRYIRKKDRDWAAEGYALEEGHSLSSLFPSSRPPSRPPSPPSRNVFKLLDPIRRVASLGNRPPLRPVTIQVTSPGLRSGQASPVLRSPSFPPPDFFNGGAPGSPRSHNVNILANGSVTSLTSRSRNSSRMDLTTLMSRPLSRASSGKI
ncbi:nucleoside phosphatase family-domain-containing protein [Cytidiella melzeri]|nr:nucleoside phosphatase family-domain-containing protein [Cytidiella melzeri]